MKKRILSLALALMLALSVFGTCVLADTSDNINASRSGVVRIAAQVPSVLVQSSDGSLGVLEIG